MVCNAYCNLHNDCHQFRLLVCLFKVYGVFWSNILAVWGHFSHDNNRSGELSLSLTNANEYFVKATKAHSLDM